MTDIGFKDIGELATQEADVTIVKSQNKSQEFYGWQIPFTESKNIFSYDISVKAGYDFASIDVVPDEKNLKVTVKLPEAKILNTDLDTDSFKLFDETQGLFTNITLTEPNTGLSEMKDEANTKAISNGLLDKAKENAQVLIKGMLASSYDFSKYTLVFEDK
ncbi:MAG: DUF4230 domain-containing protein [Erysipelotrichaceae bacterium]|nr:DUF4230 domain-containing protein [Erysipelotrichaceae bacterium]